MFPTIFGILLVQMTSIIGPKFVLRSSFYIYNHSIKSLKKFFYDVFRPNRLLEIHKYVHDRSSERPFTKRCTFRSFLRPETRIMFTRETVNSPDWFRAEVSQGHRCTARSWRRELLLQKGEVTPGRFMRVARGYSRTAALCHPIRGLPQLGVAGQTGEGCRSTIEPRCKPILDEENA